jgi:processive 1,2-diacylglycerol beta-glucosyltransferase
MGTGAVSNAGRRIIFGAGMNNLAKLWDAHLFDKFKMIRFLDIAQKKYIPRRPCILVLSVSAGNGHVRAAEALQAQAKISFPSVTVAHRDVMQFMPAMFRKIYSDWYIKLASHFPEVWGWLYRKTDAAHNGSWLGAIRKKIEHYCAHNLYIEVAQLAPDAIICTHFLPAQLLTAGAKRSPLSCPIWIQVTDFDLHQMWLHEGISGYFVATEELAYRLQSYGVAKNKIIVSGIPVMPGFSITQSRQHQENHFNLKPARTTVLMMGGGAGLGGMEALARQLLLLEEDFQLIVLAGKNKNLLASLHALSVFFPHKLFAIGFTQEVHALMVCADIVITKPGGLSTSECLVMGLPMLLVNPIPGQEERNAAFLLQEGVAIRADDPATLLYRLQNLLQDQSRLSQMRQRAKALAKPDAAIVALTVVMDALYEQDAYEAA